MKNNRFAIFLLMGLLALSLILALFGPDILQKKNATAQHAETRQMFITAKGIVESEEKLDASSRVSSTISALLVKEGDKVKKGTPLVKFDDSKIQVQVRMAESARYEARSSLKELESGYRNETHLSPVYKSATTNRLKVAISTPIVHERDDHEVCIGVLVMTVNHGDFEFFRSHDPADPDRFAVLVDGRAGPDRGMILVHPFLSQMVAEAGRVPEDLRNFRVPQDVLDEELSADTARPYSDPVSRHAKGAAYDRSWLAAAAPVELWTGENGATEASGLVVLVQEDAHTVVGPVRTLGMQLLREALSALGLVIAVIGAQWYFVSRFLV